MLLNDHTKTRSFIQSATHWWQETAIMAYIAKLNAKDQQTGELIGSEVDIAEITQMHLKKNICWVVAFK
jgi:hypothetical protein